MFASRRPHIDKRVVFVFQGVDTTCRNLKAQNPNPKEI